MGSPIAWPLWLYFGFLILALFFARKPLRHRWFFLLRSFFPSWQFYHAPGPTPRLYWRAIDGQGPLSEWQPLIDKARWHPAALFFNPAVNLAHAQQTLVEHFSNDLADRDDHETIDQWVSYRMIHRLVSSTVRDALDPDVPFQFCLCLTPTAKPVDFENDMALQSPVMRLDRP
jgi:hypothetical protein